MSSETISIKIDLNSDTAVTKLEILSDTFKKVSNITQSFSDSAINSLKGITANIAHITTAFTALKSSFESIINSTLGNVLKIGAEFETLEVSLRTVTGSSSEASKALDWIKEFTAKTPYQLEDVASAFIKLTARGINAKEVLKLLGDTASAMGKSLDQAVEAYSDALTMQFERLKEFGITTRQEGNKVVFSFIQNNKQMEIEAEKTADNIQKTLLTIFEKYKGGMEAQAQTFTGIISNIKDNFTLFFKDVADAGVFNVFKEGLNAINEELNRLKNENILQQYAKSISDSLTQLTITSLETIRTVIKIMQHTDIVEYGLIGFIFFGRKGLLGGGIFGLITSALEDIPTKIENTWIRVKSFFKETYSDNKAMMFRLEDTDLGLGPTNKQTPNIALNVIDKMINSMKNYKDTSQKTFETIENKMNDINKLKEKTNTQTKEEINLIDKLANKYKDKYYPEIDKLQEDLENIHKYYNQLLKKGVDVEAVISKITEKMSEIYEKNTIDNYKKWIDPNIISDQIDALQYLKNNQERILQDISNRNAINTLDITKEEAKEYDPSENLKSIKDIFKENLENVAGSIAKAITGEGTWDAILSSIKTGFKDVIDGFTKSNNLIELIIAALKFIAQALGIFAVFEGILKGIHIALSPLRALFEQLGEAFATAIGTLAKLLEPIAQLLKPIFDLISYIASALEPIMLALQEILYAVLKPLFAIIQPAVKVIIDVIGPVLQLIANILQNISSAIGSVSKPVGNGFEKVGDFFSDIGNSVGKVFKKIFSVGGYTGDGHPNAIAGVVHKNEYVIPSWMVNKYPDLIARLEKIRTKQYLNGGLVDAVVAYTNTNEGLPIDDTKYIYKLFKLFERIIHEGEALRVKMI